MGYPDDKKNKSIASQNIILFIIKTQKNFHSFKLRKMGKKYRRAKISKKKHNKFCFTIYYVIVRGGFMCQGSQGTSEKKSRSTEKR